MKVKIIATFINVSSTISLDYFDDLEFKLYNLRNLFRHLKLLWLWYSYVLKS